MGHFTVLYDANVLYPAPLRDILIQLATTRLYRAKWSNRIHEDQGLTKTVLFLEDHRTLL